MSLERKFDNMNDFNDRRFKWIEDKSTCGPSYQPMNYEDSKRAAYDKLRRSLCAWPMARSDNDEMDANFRDFAVDALQIQDTVVRDSQMEEIVRVRSSPLNVAYSEILITFRDMVERDFYFSKAHNLAVYRADQGSPTAGLRMDVPPYLLQTFWLLNDQGFEIRLVHGKETKRYVKFDDEAQSLYLEVKLPGQSSWVKIRHPPALHAPVRGHSCRLR